MTILASLLVFPTFVYGQDILTVVGPDRSESFSLAELLSMQQTTLVTTNDYVDEATEFRGPSLRSVLEDMAVERNVTLKLVALNDFSSEVPAADAFDYNVILAVLRDGEPMSVREKGPIWVIYPMDEHPELQDEIYNDRLVWQLKTIFVE
ncbi:molybdopterin-dependent oxidoreductase [Roseovarius sp. 217]|uniref:molybdopterin-dependent oxidoreductase n=1 Tax=Roseovarius sp. (strain 217) TaxID=314264 RepID=UPI0020C806A0|nr:molybdopterin-dependent oxidoreductase [Roseovarius sp. 217]